MHRIGTLFLAILIISLFCFSAQTFAGENCGIIKPSKLGYVAGDSSTEKYDYVVLLKLKKDDPYGAMADVEEHIGSVGDTLWRIGTLDNVVVFSIQSSAEYNALLSRYARASRITRLCTVYSRSKWSQSKAVTAVSFGDRRIGSLCK